MIGTVVLERVFEQKLDIFEPLLPSLVIMARDVLFERREVDWIRDFFIIIFISLFANGLLEINNGI